MINVAGAFQSGPSSPTDMAAVPFRHHVMNDNVTGDSGRSHRWDTTPGGHQVFPPPPSSKHGIQRTLQPQFSGRRLQTFGRHKAAI